MNISERLSSDFLFHYTPTFECLKNILKTGFRFCLSEEEFPIEILDSKIFMICFCDIKVEEAILHREHYGNYAVVLHKSWGIENGITPVQYIHETSIPRAEDYWEIKELFANVKTVSPKGFDKLVRTLLITSLLIDYTKKNNPITEDDYFKKKEAFEKELSKIFNEFSEEQQRAFVRYITILFNRLMTINNCFERRNAYLKSYTGNLIRGNEIFRDKVFYDEREWRAVRPITVMDQITDQEFYNKAIEERRLPDEFNLKFSDDNVEAILVEKSDQVTELKDLVKANNYLLITQKIIDKISPIDEFVGRN